MTYKYKGIIINYDIIGQGNPIILLHGWGTNKDTFSSLSNLLKNNYEVHLIDLIGFGKSEEPFKPFSLSDYVYFLNDYIRRNNLNKPIILGHSFGGRIAIKYASMFKNIDKLILVDSAGIKKKKTLKNKIKILRYKLKKKWYKLTKNSVKYKHLINNSGSYDYRHSSTIMKATLSKIVNEDLKKDLKDIYVETLIIWGKDDKETPYNDALIMNKLLRNSGLVTLENTGHFPYLESKYEFNKIILTFLGVQNDIY